MWQLLPWGLRDFFVMDTDEATDFVGGIESSEMKISEVIEKTSSSVRSLLGIEVFKNASKRVGKIGDRFGAKATRSIGNIDLTSLQEDLDRFREQRDQLQESIEQQLANRRELENSLGQLEDRLEDEIKDIGAADNYLGQRFIKIKQNMNLLKERRRSLLDQLAGEIESIDLLASLASIKIVETYNILNPLYEQGHIPLRHLTFVRSLIDSGTCVCSQDLTTDSIYRQQVEHQIRVSAEQEERADYLAQLYDASKSLVSYLNQPKWNGRIEQYNLELISIDDEISDLQMEMRDIQYKLDQIDEEKIQRLRDEIRARKIQRDNINRNLPINEQRLESVEDKLLSLQKTIQQRQRNEQAATRYRAAEDISELVVTVLDSAYNTIQENQIGELSSRMNRLFSQMAANVSDEDYIDEQRNRATLRMISEIGLRPVRDQADKYEIYALNSRGHSMPAIQINGASRRVLALSFVLALCKESKTDAPLIADSLLNFMSGRVRTNVLRVTAINSSQPILLLTGSDLQSELDVDVVSRYAGATYTLTGQWDAIDAGIGGDVINWTDERLVSLACTSGPRQYCPVCERTGQRDLPGWTEHTTMEDS